MSLLASLYRSSSLTSTLASIAAHLLAAVLVYFGLANYFEFGVTADKQPPTLSFNFQQPTAESLAESTTVLPAATVLPPLDSLPQVHQSAELELPAEVPSEEVRPDITYHPVRPWMPAQLRVRPTLEPKTPAALPATTASANAVIVDASKELQQCPPPQYPRLSRKKGEQGTVTLIVDIRADGQVAAVTVQTSSGYKALDDAALEAVRTWKYLPATTDGQPQASQILQAVVFTIQPNR